jgi:hypothetical protein
MACLMLSPEYDTVICQNCHPCQILGCLLSMKKERHIKQIILQFCSIWR